MRFFSALATSLSLASFSNARVAPSARSDVHRRDAAPANAIVNTLNRLLRKDSDIEEGATLAACVLDAYYNFVSDASVGPAFCSALMHYPNHTAVIDYSPISTSTFAYTSITATEYTTVRETPYTTVTVTVGLPDKLGKRSPDTTPAPRATNSNAVAGGLSTFRRQLAANGTSDPSDAQMSASFSSACACQTYAGLTVTSTYTGATSIVTQSAFFLDTTTVVTTRTAAVEVTTVTVTPEVAPTTPSFSCPLDNNVTVSQMVGTARYDYLIICDTDVSDSDVYSLLSYNTLSECAAACSVADTMENSHVCEGFSYYNTGRDEGYNCFLKGSANNTFPAAGVHSGILQRIALGLQRNNTAGTTSEVAPFTDHNPDPTSASSAISSALGNSTTSMPVMTPAPAIAPSGLLVRDPGVSGLTSFSTYVSDGTTFSTGSVFSTYYSNSGSWYYSYATSWTVAWSSATTLYASSETGTAVGNTTQSKSQTSIGDSGDYSTIITTNYTTYLPGGGEEITQVISNVTYNSEGQQIASTATTHYYSSATGVSGGAAGGSAGRVASEAAPITSTFSITASTGVFFTVAVISNSGYTAGGSAFAGSGVVQTPAPSISATTIGNSYGTAYSSGYIVSGAVRGSNGLAGTVVSGIVTSISSTVVSAAISGASNIAGSGAIVPGISHFHGPIIPASSVAAVTVSSGPALLSVPSALPFTISNAFHSGLPFPPSGFPTGTAPASVSDVTLFNNAAQPRSGSPLSSGSVFRSSSVHIPLGPGPVSLRSSLPSGSIHIPLGPGPVSESGLFRFGAPSNSGTAPSGTAATGTSPVAPGTSPVITFPPYPTAASSCVTNNLGTTTIFTTVMLYGCYSNCPAPGASGANPLTFGSPRVGEGSYGS